MSGSLKQKCDCGGYEAVFERERGGGDARRQQGNAVRIRQPGADPFGGVRRTSRARRYLAEDVQKLRERKEYRRNPAQVAQDALHWGTPVLDSALTLITDTGLYYHWRDALGQRIV